MDCPPLVAVVFPAIVSAPTTTLTSAKVFVAPDRVWVVTDAPGGPQVVAEYTGTVMAFSNNTFELTQADGTLVEIRKGGGCGCGSKLRGYSPFNGPLRVGT